MCSRKRKEKKKKNLYFNFYFNKVAKSANNKKCVQTEMCVCI